MLKRCMEVKRTTKLKEQRFKPRNLIVWIKVFRKEDFPLKAVPLDH